MLKLVPLLALPVVLLGYSAVSATMNDKLPRIEDGVRCEVRTASGARGVQIQAVATAGRAVTGNYRFEVEKRGAAGTSQTAQSGEFALHSGEETVLGEVTLGTVDRAAYTAELVLRWQGGKTSCNRS